MKTRKSTNVENPRVKNIAWFKEKGEKAMLDLCQRLNKAGGLMGEKFQFEKIKEYEEPQGAPISEYQLNAYGFNADSEYWDESIDFDNVDKILAEWIKDYNFSEQQKPEIITDENYGHGVVGITLELSNFSD